MLPISERIYDICPLGLAYFTEHVGLQMGPLCCEYYDSIFFITSL